KGFVLPGTSSSASPVTAVPGAAFEATVEPEKSDFAVGEAIRFKASGNQDFFLYLININADGETTFLYPAPGTSPRRLKAGVEHVLPESYNIVVDEPGSEQVLVVTSLAPIDLSQSKGIVVPGSSPQVGERLVSELTVDVVAARAFPFTVTPTPSEAVVRVMNIGPKYEPGMVLPPGEYRLEVAAQGYKTAELTVAHTSEAKDHSVVLEKVGTAVSGDTSGPEIMLNADRETYTDGDLVSVQYGASRAGWVHIYTYSEGDLKNVSSREVEDGKFYTMKATATEPHGEQLLLALWQPGESVSSAALSSIKADLAAASDTNTSTSQRALVLSVEESVDYKTLRFVVNP
ncbi:MAG: DUF4384 domain-containing protein, partial [Pseudomonadota bacterium]